MWASGRRKKGSEALTTPASFFSDRGFVLQVVTADGFAILLAPRYRSDREVVMSAVRQSGSSLEFAAEELCADRCVVLSAVEQVRLRARTD